MSYYKASLEWFWENRHKLNPLRQSTFFTWLRIMKEELTLKEVEELWPTFKDWYYKKYRYMGADGPGLILLWNEFIKNKEENIKWAKEFKWKTK